MCRNCYERMRNSDFSFVAAARERRAFETGAKLVTTDAHFRHVAGYRFGCRNSFQLRAGRSGACRAVATTVAISARIGEMHEGMLQELVKHYRSRLAEALEGIVLYGSRARGNARPDSDVDLLLVATALPDDPFERSRLLSAPRLGYNQPSVSTRGLTTHEYERDIASIDLDIAIDGQILFDKVGYMAERLSLIRRRLDEAGLFRNSELVWRWRRWPTRSDWAVTWEGVRL